MTDLPHRALLPDGFHDVLPPDAAHEANTVARLVETLERHGYDRVKPPLVEFEDTLLAGSGAGLAPSTFRLMDPISQRMMGVRADMTVQVARIAGFRLARAPRPLRLCYAGQVLIVRGDQLRPERQIAQVGAELIGAAGLGADVEIISLAVEALTGVGIPMLAVDLNAPLLVPTLLGALGVRPEQRASLRQALDRKDPTAVRELAGPEHETLQALIDSAGTPEHCRRRLADVILPAPVRALLDRLFAVEQRIGRQHPSLTITVDPVEHRGFEYHNGVSFILLAHGIRGALGRGGRYDAPHAREGDQTATGFTLFLDSIIRAVPRPAGRAKLFLPLGHDRAAAEALRAQGWVTLSALDDLDPHSEADKLGCTHLLGTSGPVAIGPAKGSSGTSS